MDNNNQNNNKCNWYGCTDGKCYHKGWRKLIFAIVLLFILGLVANWVARTYANYTSLRTISITGVGEVSAVPDVSTINFTIRSSNDSNDTQALQDEVAKKADAVFAKLKELGIEEKDIKTTNYSVNPRYGYQECLSSIRPCDTSVVIGYEANESVDVKVRNTENVSKVLNVLALEQVTEVYGPNFDVDDIQKVKDEARDLAIKDAKEKADVLSKSLGVKIKRIVGYSDDTGNYAPIPMMYSAKAEVMNQVGGAMGRDANIVEGEQKVNSTVTITFQIED